MNYTGQVNWSDWQQMPDYRSGWRDKNKSSIGSIITYLDPHTSLGYMPVFKNVDFLRQGSDFSMKGNEALWTGANRVLEPILTAESKILGKYDPVRYSLSKAFPEQHANVTNWVNTHGADAAAIAAATYFTAGAAGAAVGSAAGGGAAATGAGGAAAGSALGGGAAASGTGAISALGSAAITPAFSSTVGAGLSSSAAAGAAGLGYGGLGAAGTAAGLSAITPALASLGTAGSSLGLLGSLKAAYGTVKPYTSMASNIKSFADANKAPTDRERYASQAGAMAERVLQAGEETARQRIAKQLVINKFGMRK